MQKLYKKSEIWFAIIWIIVYVVGTSLADSVSEAIGAPKSLTFLLHLAMTAVALVWLKKNSLLKEYGLCKTSVKASKFLFYIPLVLIVSVNLWFGVRMNMPISETLFYIGSMLCVGFLEELIFRGFLFRAMAKDNAASAIIVSSVTFGIGHIVNLFNGSGADLLSNICQVFYAMAAGFLFVTIFYRSKTLLPCIVTHSAVNALSAFANDAVMTPAKEIITAVALFVISVAYTLVLCKTLPKGDDKEFSGVDK